MKIIICGNYGAGNIGDELILKGILKYFGAGAGNSHHKITVLSAKPSFTRKLHKIDSLKVVPAGIKSFFKGILNFSFLRTLSEIRKCDLFILGGGSLFDDTYPRASFIWGMQALAAYIFKKPIFLLANGFGPLNTFTGKLITRMVCDYAKWITVRDQSSLILLRQLGIKKKIYVTADPVFGLSKADFCPKNAKPQMNKPYIIVSPYDAAALNSTIPFTSNKKFVQALNQIQTKYKFEIDIVPFQNEQKTDNFCKIYNLFENAGAIVGMRLHPLILAIISGKPFIAISNFEKIKNLLLENNLSELFLSPNDKNFAKKFKTIFDNLVKNHAAYKVRFAQIKANLSLKSNINKNILTKVVKAL